MRNILVLASLSVLLSSCFSVDFLVPQPQGAKNLTEFPKSIVGTYVMNGDTIEVKARSYTMVDEKYDENIAVTEIKNNDELRLTDDFIYDAGIDPELPLKYIIENDTVKYHYTKKVEFFLSDSVVIRKYKKFTVLNLREGKNWTVILIARQKNANLHIAMIHDGEGEDGLTIAEDSLIGAIETVCKVTHTGESSYLINPSKTEFKKLIKIGAFRLSGKPGKLD